MTHDHSQTTPAGDQLPAPPAALRGALVSAISGRRRRARYRLAVTGGVLVALGAVLLGGGVFSSGPSQVLAIDNSEPGWVKVSILDGQAGADQMTQELQSAGIDGQVQLLPATPDLIGHWMGVREVNESSPPCGGATPAGLSCANPPLLSAGEASFSGDSLEIRSDAISKLNGAQLAFYVGRAPEGNEQPLEGPPPQSG